MGKWFAALAFVLSAISAQAADLQICAEGAYPPFSEVSPDGKLVGFDIDITHALCTAMGKTCSVVQIEWDGMIPALLEGKCDAIIASMAATPERKRVIDFSEKYYLSPGQFVARKGVDWQDTNEGLKGKIIGVQRGTIHQRYLEEQYPDAKLRLYANQEDAYLDLISGRIDAILADSIAVSGGFLAQERGRDYAFFGEPHADPKYYSEGVAVGVRKEDTELRDDFSAAIKSIRATGVYQEINSKYFDFDIY